MEGLLKEFIGIMMVLLGVEIVAAQRVKESKRGEQTDSAEVPTVDVRHTRSSEEVAHD